MDTKPQRPTAMTGRTQPRRKMFHKNRPAATMEMKMRRLNAGSWALTSV
jgi:hypothetical protein